MTAILNQDDVTHVMLHHGVVMAIKNYVTMKDTSAQTYRQSPTAAALNIYRCSSSLEAGNG